MPSSITLSRPRWMSAELSLALAAQANGMNETRFAALLSTVESVRTATVTFTSLAR